MNWSTEWMKEAKVEEEEDDDDDNKKKNELMRKVTLLLLKTLNRPNFPSNIVQIFS